MSMTAGQRFERVQLHGHSGDDGPRLFDRVRPQYAASHGANERVRRLVRHQ